VKYILRSRIFGVGHQSSWTFGVDIIDHFPFVFIKSGLTFLLRCCDKHFGPMTWHDWVWIGLCLARQVKTATLSSNMLEGLSPGNPHKVNSIPGLSQHPKEEAQGHKGTRADCPAVL
jgi:hypothetical protein